MRGQVGRWKGVVGWRRVEVALVGFALLSAVVAVGVSVLLDEGLEEIEGEVLVGSGCFVERFVDAFVVGVRWVVACEASVG